MTQMPRGEYKQARERAMREFESAFLKDLLEKYPDNFSEAARAAGLDRRRLCELLKRNNLYVRSD